MEAKIVKKETPSDVMSATFRSLKGYCPMTDMREAKSYDSLPETAAFWAWIQDTAKRRVPPSLHDAFSAGVAWARQNTPPVAAVKCEYCGDTGKIEVAVDGEVTCPECGYQKAQPTPTAALSQGGEVMRTHLIDRLNARTVETLPADWKSGLKCPRCDVSADRPICFLDLALCPRHDPDEYTPNPHVVEPDPLCSEAAAEITRLTKEVESLRAALIEAGNAGGGAVSDRASTEFLIHVPKQVQAFVARLKARTEAAEAEVERLKGQFNQAVAMLRQHHDWHAQAGEIGLPDGQGGWIAIDNAAEYGDSLMHERTLAVLNAADAEESWRAADARAEAAEARVRVLEEALAGVLPSEHGIFGGPLVQMVATYEDGTDEDSARHKGRISHEAVSRARATLCATLSTEKEPTCEMSGWKIVPVEDLGGSKDR